MALSHESQKIESPLVENLTSHPVYRYMANILSDKGKSVVHDTLLNELTSSQSRLEINDLLLKDAEIHLKYKTAMLSDYDYLNQEEQEIKKKLSLYDEDEVAYIRKLMNNLEYLEKKNRLILTDNQANKIFQRLIQMSVNNNHKNYSMFFVDMDSQEPQDLASKTIEMNVSDTIKIPIGMFVGAHGFENWHGRGENTLKNEQDSNKVIQNYANKPSETAPPINDIIGYLYPNGELLFVSGNAHRLAAAIQRGDDEVQFTGSLTLHLMENNTNPLTPNHYNQTKK